MFYFNKNRDFVKYWLAQNISALGDAIRRISLTLWVFDISSGSGLAIALLAMVEITPQLVLAPFTGVLIDRWDRKTILIITNICRALLSLLLIIATVNENLVLAYFFISISSIFAAFSSLTQDAIVPTLVEDKDLQAANSAIQIGRQLAFVLGPLTGAYFYTSYGFESSFLFDAATFLLAAILFYFLPIVSSIILRKSQKLNFVSFLDDFVAGLKYLQSSEIIRASMIITVLFSIASGINSTTMIFFITKNLERQAADIAYLSVANGITQILIGSYILIYARKMPLNKLLLFSLFIMSIGAIVIASSATLYMLIFGVLVVSLGNSPFNIAQRTLVQKYSYPHILGRIQSLIFFAGTTAFLLSSTAAGLTIKILSARSLLWISATLTILSGIYTLVVLVPLLSKQKIVEDSLK